MTYISVDGKLFNARYGSPPVQPEGTFDGRNAENTLVAMHIVISKVLYRTGIDTLTSKLQALALMKLSMDLLYSTYHMFNLSEPRADIQVFVINSNVKHSNQP